MQKKTPNIANTEINVSINRQVIASQLTYLSIALKTKKTLRK